MLWAFSRIQNLAMFFRDFQKKMHQKTVPESTGNCGLINLPISWNVLNDQTLLLELVEIQGNPEQRFEPSTLVAAEENHWTYCSWFRIRNPVVTHQLRLGEDPMDLQGFIHSRWLFGIYSIRHKDNWNMKYETCSWDLRKPYQKPT